MAPPTAIGYAGTTLPNSILGATMPQRIRRTISINTADDLRVVDYFDDGTFEDVSENFQNVLKAAGVQRVRVYVDLDFDAEGKASIGGGYASKAALESSDVDADKLVILDIIRLHHREALS